MISNYDIYIDLIARRFLRRKIECPLLDVAHVIYMTNTLLFKDKTLKKFLQYKLIIAHA